LLPGMFTRSTGRKRNGKEIFFSLASLVAVSRLAHGRSSLTRASVPKAVCYGHLQVLAAADRYLYGYIGYGLNEPHGVLEFSIQCRRPAVVAITYLKSYEQVGAVRVYGSHLEAEGVAAAAAELELALVPSSKLLLSELTIDALDALDHSSVPITVYLQMSSADDIAASAAAAIEAAGVHAAAYSNYTVAFELLGPPDIAFISESTRRSNVDERNRGGWKFKLLKLACC
jgi:hypothetical protein